MMTFDTIGEVSQAGCDGIGPTNGTAVFPVSKPASAQIAGRIFYHGRNFTPITEGDVTEQELECDFTRSTQHARMLLEDIVDINVGEKTLMMMWNEHVITYDGLGQDDLTRVLSDFVESHFHAMSDLDLYGNFVCHMTTLQQAGLITQERDRQQVHEDALPGPYCRSCCSFPKP